MSTKNKISSWLLIASLAVAVSACKSLKIANKTENRFTPASYQGSQDSTNTSKVHWKDFFRDQNLIALIDTALKNNQELNIIMQEINVAKAEVRAKKGEYLPSAGLAVGAGLDKVGRYTRDGAVEENLPIKDGKAFPEPLGNFMVGFNASWEIDIWRKLRNGRDAAASRYLGTVEGKNFMVTNLVAEISESYYELMAYDNKLMILTQNLEIQKNALEIVKMQKIAGEVTELAVKKFEAEVYKNQSHLFYLRQQIVEAENRVNFLVGRFPQPVIRNSTAFQQMVPDTIYSGIPSQLLENRPDIRQAELNLVASKLDVKVARANFYPSLRITAGVGYQAFNVKYLINSPQSLLYNIAGDLVAPLINRNALKAKYFSAKAKQIQTVYSYEKTILNAYIEVVNRMSKIDNLKNSYDLKQQQVDALTQSITISTNLFKSAKADYMEVLMTQRDAIEAKFDLVEIKQEQLSNMVSMYQSLGGGWR
ncbi:TolC family protein [Fluviicola taffensis]|uniref:RND efflux system, outer membrane lipoprotein, NodT family n=1 Tax=Fluviicola taffensis (strain DSM 16823 / NCIMB 13979 / RW262) TaxID=755732 RepID=F2IB64_FLUTR|nr:efflux transporter outer membrane subunit [Fluviicola taffensis]AEA42147.1 RND efflux system, outer membrane lipoprotein, NodT family [Fluviicola taffensis DSM 16823]